MKKIFVILMTMLFAFAMTSCKNEPKTVETPKKAPIEGCFTFGKQDPVVLIKDTNRPQIIIEIETFDSDSVKVIE